MASHEETIRLYAQLAEEHQKQGHPQERDRFLLLAADAALTAGKREVAENFRRTLLARNPNHLLKPYTTLTEALGSPDIASYVQELRKTYPVERLQRVTKSAPPGGTHLGREKEAEPDILLPMELERHTKAQPPFSFLPDSMTAKAPPRSVPSRAAPAPIPVASPGAFALKREPLPPRPTAIPARPRVQEEAPSGGWLGAFLFFIALLGALALLGHVFVRPFLGR